MNRLVGLIVLLAISTHAENGYRTFTTPDGRTLKAKIIMFDSATDKVQIEREDKKKVTVPSNSFSEKDQAYIKKWQVAQTFMSASKFKLDIKRKEVKSSKKPIEVDLGEEGGGGGRRGGGDTGVQVVAIDKNTQYKYSLLMENKSDTPLKNIILEYRIFYEQQKSVLDEKANKNRPEDSTRPEQYTAVDQNKIKDAKVRVKPIDARSTQELATASVTLLNRSASREWGDKIDLKSNLIGAWIQLTMKGPDGEELVREIATANSIMKKYDWDATQEEPIDENSVEKESTSEETPD
ncbi:MAG: hypothetical protein V3V05_02585 [Pontiella sp.]